VKEEATVYACCNIYALVDNDCVEKLGIFLVCATVFVNITIVQFIFSQGTMATVCR